MSIKVTSRSEVSVQRTLTLGPGAQDRVTNRGANTLKLKFTEKSKVPMRESAHFAQPLVNGTATIDLLALPAHNAPTPVTAGMRVQVLKVINPGPGPLTVQAAETNGYPLHFTIPPQSFAHFEHDNTMPPVESNCHLVTLKGIGAATSNWMIVLG